MRPSVSVVMSTYNDEIYIRNSIESILNQTLTDFEFIIVNDGSFDRTREILDSYNDSRIIQIHQENTGLTKALNKGISLARGKYIARQDADDVSRPQRLELQVAYMESHPEVGLLGSRFEVIDKDGMVLRPALLPTEDSSLRARLPAINQFCHASVIIRREALEKVGPFRDFFIYSQDYDLWLRIAEHYQVANLPDLLVQYRERHDAISSKKLLTQTSYAAVAAYMAEQRKNVQVDDLTKGIIPTLPDFAAFPDALKEKLTSYYASHSADLLTALTNGDAQADFTAIVERICAERIQLEALTREQAFSLRQKDLFLKAKEEEVRAKEADLQAREAELTTLDHILQEKNAVILAREKRIHDLLNSASWRLTKPLRFIFSKLTKRDPQNTNYEH